MLKQIFYSLCILVGSHFLFASAGSPPSETQKDTKELNLGKDRAYLEKLREDIPEDVRSENDDLAFILKLFEDKKRSPSKIRREFNKVVRKRRKQSQKKFKKARLEYTKNEKAQRKKFIKEEKKKRIEFLEKDSEKDVRKEYFVEERSRRKSFFSDEKEKRKDFESEARAEKKEFDSFVKDKRKQFDDQLKAFTKEQKELKKLEKAQKKRSSYKGRNRPQKRPLSKENQKYLEDFNKVPEKTGLSLQPKEE